MLSDVEYMKIASKVSWKSRCKKRQLGCILVDIDGGIIEGTNGAPVPLKSCDPCPRMVRNSISGADLDLCRAVHAERQTLLIAARYGIKTCGSKLFSYMGVPCKDCFLELVEAGISEIICSQETYYDELSKEIAKEWIRMGGKLRFINMEKYDRN